MQCILSRVRQNPYVSCPSQRFRDNSMKPRPCAWGLKSTNSWDINSWILPKLRFQRVSPNTWLLSASQSPREVSSATDQRERQEWIQARGGTCAGSSTPAQPGTEAPWVRAQHSDTGEGIPAKWHLRKGKALSQSWVGFWPSKTMPILTSPALHCWQRRFNHVRAMPTFPNHKWSEAREARISRGGLSLHPRSGFVRKHGD